MACARALQRSPRSVCVVDPGPPGSGCSFGNAGVIATEHVLPLSRTAMLWRLPRMLLWRDAPLRLHPARLPRLLPWMRHFAAACRPARMTSGSRAIAALTGAAMRAWQGELGASGGTHLLRNHGMYSVYRSEAAFAADAFERARQRELGVRSEVLTVAELGEREPALACGLVRAVHYPDVGHVVNPEGLVRCLAKSFSDHGGVIAANVVRSFASEPHQVLTCTTSGRLRSRYVVLAAGLGSARLCETVGVRIPLAAEMGYHVTFPGAEKRLHAPVAVVEDGFIATPMSGHLRLAGTVDLAAREMPPAWHRATVLTRAARRLFRDPLPEPTERWHGSRPTLPDFLPAIGALPGHPRILAAFGHQHIGLTTAAITGALVRDLIAGVTPALDMAPYHPGRFSSPRQ